MDIESENILLNRLKDSAEDSEKTILELVFLYEKAGEHMKAVPYLQQLIANTQDADKVARYYLNLGQLMEQAEKYESAVSYYSQALSIETKDKRVWYFIHNNLGYCLTVLGRYDEAGDFLVKAMNIDATFPNAYKNGGILLENEGKFNDAVQFYMLAVMANPYDTRALKHLNNLLLRHPELQVDMNSFNEMVEERKKSMIAGQTFEEFCGKFK